MCNAGSAVGNIVGPLLFSSNQAPLYHSGLGATLGIFIACAALSAYVPSLPRHHHRHHHYHPTSPLKPPPPPPSPNSGPLLMVLRHRMLMVLLRVMNIAKEKTRVNNGKPAKLYNSSMAKAYAAGPADEVDANGNRLGDNAFSDMTDRQNDEVGSGRSRWLCGTC